MSSIVPYKFCVEVFNTFYSCLFTENYAKWSMLCFKRSLPFSLPIQPLSFRSGPPCGKSQWHLHSTDRGSLFFWASGMPAFLNTLLPYFWGSSLGAGAKGQSVYLGILPNLKHNWKNIRLFWGYNWLNDINQTA